MISKILIKDFAIIDTIDVDFMPGLNIITGETGAGKSIIIEAISLALGSRADTAFIRTAKEKALIQIVVDIEGEEHILTRELLSSGKSSCKIDGEIVTVSALNQFGKKVADIHGQYDHQSLLNPENHINFIDSYNSNAISPLKEQVADIYIEYTQAKKELSDFIANKEDYLKRIDFMKFEYSEITKINPLSYEDTELSEHISLMENSEKIYSSLSEAYNLLYDDEVSGLSNIGKVIHSLKNISNLNTQIDTLTVTVEDAYYKLEDASQELRNIKDSMIFSEEELNTAIERLNSIEHLKKKYGGTVEKILKYKDTIEKEINQVENTDEHIDHLTEKVSVLTEKLKEKSTELTNERRETAKNIEEKINFELNELNFQDTVLTVNFAEAKDFTASGKDVIEFLLVTNKGETPKPLSKIASGGEISRIMLAFKRIIGQYDKLPTMIFDEIDTGISGATASIVGNKLKEISEEHQILCITHLPQIASKGTYNYKIQKESDQSSTYTTIIPLSEDEKIMEVARLIGGTQITETTISNAKELILSK